MSCLRLLLTDQRLMTGQAEFTLVRRHLQQAGDFSAMRSMATRTFSAGEGPVLPVKPFLRLGFLMTGITEAGLTLSQQSTFVRFMGIVTFETKALLGRSMWIRGLGICSPGVA